LWNSDRFLVFNQVKTFHKYPNSAIILIFPRARHRYSSSSSSHLLPVADDFCKVHAFFSPFSPATEIKPAASKAHECGRNPRRDFIRSFSALIRHYR